MSNLERSEYTRQILAMTFDDGEGYTKEELDNMDDEELKECFDAESQEEPEDDDDEIELETCFVCAEVKVCPFVDDETGASVCAKCAEESEDDSDEELEDIEDEDETEG